MKKLAVSLAACLLSTGLPESLTIRALGVIGTVKDAIIF